MTVKQRARTTRAPDTRRECANEQWLHANNAQLTCEIMRAAMCGQRARQHSRHARITNKYRDYTKQVLNEKCLSRY